MTSKLANYTHNVIRQWHKSTRLLLQDVPNWYRHLSRPQIAASEALNDAIRDDMEQISTHRVLYLLQEIGLKPIVSSKQVKLVMEMSKGDALAFIWFLWESNYKTDPITHKLDSYADTCDMDNTKTYSINEQILLSVIFRLDLYATLFALDRVLPKGHDPPSQLAAVEQREQLRKQQYEKQKQEKRSLPLKRVNNSPYFQPIVLPRRYGRRLVIPRPPISKYYLRKPKFSREPVLRTMDHWFQHFKFNDNEKMVKTLVRNEIENIFYKMTENGIADNQLKSLCTHHKVIDSVEKSLAMRLKLIAQEQAVRFCDVDTQSREVRRQRIVKELELASESFLERFREEAHKTRFQAARKELFTPKCAACQIAGPKPDFISVDNALRKLPFSRLSGGAEKVRKPKQSKKRSRSSEKARKHKRRRKKKLMKGSSNTEMPMPEPPPKSAEAKRPICPEIGAGDAPTSAEEDEVAANVRELNGFKYVTHHKDSFIKMCESDVLRRAEVGRKHATSSQRKTTKLHNLDTETKSIHSQNGLSNVFFKMPPNSADPYQLDYGKIFEARTLNSDELWLKTEFIKAVNADIDLMNRLVDEEYDTVLSEAVHRDVLRDFQDGKAYFDQTYVRLKENAAKLERLDFNQTIFDPDDDVLMNNLLRLGLQHICETNHSLVAPTLPNAWNIPFLNEWIVHRYGKRYTLSELVRLHKISRSKLVSFTAMFKRWHIPKPDIAKTSPNLVDYGNVKCLKAKDKRLCEEYNRHFYHVMMAACRAFLFALKPRLCFPGIIDTFYAYFPARHNDLRFNVSSR